MCVEYFSRVSLVFFECLLMFSSGLGVYRLSIP